MDVIQSFLISEMHKLTRPNFPRSRAYDGDFVIDGLLSAKIPKMDCRASQMHKWEILQNVLFDYTKALND